MSLRTRFFADREGGVGGGEGGVGDAEMLQMKCCAISIIAFVCADSYEDVDICPVCVRVCVCACACACACACVCVCACACVYLHRAYSPDLLTDFDVLPGHMSFIRTSG